MDSIKLVADSWQRLEDGELKARNHFDTSELRDMDEYPWTGDDQALLQRSIAEMHTACRRIEERQKAIYRLQSLMHERLIAAITAAAVVILIGAIAGWLR